MKVIALGLKLISVPVFLLSSPTIFKRSFATPFVKAILYTLLFLYIVRLNVSDKAFTTEIPTP